jgi:cobalt-zinc-cadmium efflux system membrane fusion protein
MKLKMLLLLATLPLALSACGRSEDSGTSVSPSSDAGTARHEKEGEANHEDEGGHIELTAEQIEAAGIQLHHECRTCAGGWGAIPRCDPQRRAQARRHCAAGRLAGQHREQRELAGVRRAVAHFGCHLRTQCQSWRADRRQALYTWSSTLSTVWVELSLFARDAAKVKVGQSVLVKSPVAEFSAQGKVTYVGPFGNSNQALTARVEVPNPQNRWAPGLYVTGEVTLAQKTAALAVRSSAIQMIEDRPVVFVQSEGRFSAHPVTLGKTDGERTEVLQGLAAGDTYVATNSYVIKAELRKSEAEED